MKIASLEKIEEMISWVVDDVDGKYFISDTLYEFIYGDDDEFTIIKDNCEFIISKVNENNKIGYMEISDILKLANI